VPLANSRRVNHFAAGIFVGLGHLFAGLRALAGTHNTGVHFLYFMRIKECEFEINNASKGEALCWLLVIALLL
jgi:hypothetical protein